MRTEPVADVARFELERSVLITYERSGLFCRAYVFDG